MRVLLAEDSRRLRESLSRALARLGHAVDAAEDGEEAEMFARGSAYDVVVLDLLMPVRGGLAVLEGWRRKGNEVPVIILTALNAVEDRVRGLALGADDYVVKPFAVEELLARMEAVVRRRFGKSDSKRKIGPLEIDLAGRAAWLKGEPISLTAREFSLLECLARRPGRVMSRERIEEALYGESASPLSNAVDAAVYSLRKKLSLEGEAPLIQTRRGLGYVLEAP